MKRDGGRSRPRASHPESGRSEAPGRTTRRSTASVPCRARKACRRGRLRRPPPCSPPGRFRRGCPAGSRPCRPYSSPARNRRGEAGRAPPRPSGRTVPCRGRRSGSGPSWSGVLPGRRENRVARSPPLRTVATRLRAARRARGDGDRTRRVKRGHRSRRSSGPAGIRWRGNGFPRRSSGRRARPRPARRRPCIRRRCRRAGRPSPARSPFPPSP